MGLPEKKFCKCGHDKKLHRKNPNSKWSLTSYCRKCPCTDYMNRKKPDKFDYLMMGIAVSMGMLLIVISSIMLIEANPEVMGTGETEITFTLNEVYSLLQLLFIVIFVFFSMWFIVEPVLDVLHEKRRRKFPIDDPDA